MRVGKYDVGCCRHRPHSHIENAMRILGRPLRARTLAIAASLAAVTPGVIPAQYFGRNKVQYENFSFRILRTPHFDVHFYPQEEEAVRDAGRMLERWNARQSVLLRH